MRDVQEGRGEDQLTNRRLDDGGESELGLGDLDRLPVEFVPAPDMFNQPVGNSGLCTEP